MLKKDLTGRKFGRLTVLKEAPKYKSPSGRLWVMWECLCDCGNKSTIRSSSLTSKSNPVKSCGCLSTELTRERATTHGKTHSRTYNSWQSMKKRCQCKTDPSYKNYGGRGITVCQEWLDSFENFYRDMGERPPNTSIDRIDNDKGYYKENCRWATKSEQMLNRRKVGKTSKFFGISFCNHYKKFSVQVFFKGIRYSLGKKYFDNEMDAAKEYNNIVLRNNLPHNLNKLD